MLKYQRPVFRFHAVPKGFSYGIFDIAQSSINISKRDWAIQNSKKMKTLGTAWNRNQLVPKTTKSFQNEDSGEYFYLGSKLLYQKGALVSWVRISERNWPKTEPLHIKKSIFIYSLHSKLPQISTKGNMYLSEVEIFHVKSVPVFVIVYTRQGNAENIYQFLL